MPSDYEINWEGTSVKYKRSKYLWDDIPLLIQRAYRKHEVVADRFGKVPLSVYSQKYFIEIDFIFFYSINIFSLEFKNFDQRL